METLPLRPRQEDATRFLLHQITQGKYRELGLSALPGFGKSKVQQVLGTQLLHQGFRLTITLAPQILIEESLCPDEDTLYSFRDGEQVQVSHRDWAKLREPEKKDMDDSTSNSQKRATGAARLRNALRAVNPTDKHIVTTYQAFNRWLTEDLTLLPDDLHDVAFFFDEGHHVSEVNVAGKHAQALKTADAVLIYLSATLYRYTGKILIDTKIQPIFTVSVAEAMSEPDGSRYCPQYLDMRLDVVPQGTKTQWEETQDRLCDLMAQDNHPKSLILLSPGRSEAQAKDLIRTIRARFPELRVHNAVGAKTKDETKALLKREREITDYSESEVDIIIACARFDEGTDWPPCSHVYCLNRTDSIGRFIQWFGRALRDKKKFKGYPVEYVEKAVFTLIITPGMTEQDCEDGWQDRVVLSAAMMADCKVVPDYLRDELRQREEQDRQRSGHENKQAWAALIQRLGCEEVAVRAGLLTVAKVEIALIAEGCKPSELELHRVISKMKSLVQTRQVTAEDQDIALRYLLLRQAKTEPRVAKQHISNLRRKMSEHEDKINDWRWVTSLLQQEFAQVVDEYKEWLVPDLVSGGLSKIAKLTGQTNQAVAQSLVTVLSWDRKYIKVSDFKQAHGYLPEDPDDREHGWLAKWLNAQRAQHRHNELEDSRKDRLEQLGVDLLQSDEDKVSELIRRCEQDPDWIPCNPMDSIEHLAVRLRRGELPNQQARVAEAVPDFEWNQECALFKHNLQEYGDAILQPGTIGYLWYETHHVNCHLKGKAFKVLSPEIRKYIEGTALDQAFRQVYEQRLAQRLAPLRNRHDLSPDSLTKDKDIKAVSEFISRVIRDRLLACERDILFGDKAFEPLIRVLATAPKNLDALKGTLKGVGIEADIHPKSLVGFWWLDVLQTEDRYRYGQESLRG